jgi:hypothetical protein
VKKVPWIGLVAVAIPIAVLFGPALLGGRSFALRDAAHFYHPLFELCSREWAAGRVPLWNPYENCGVPLMADATSSVFYPGKLIFLLPVDFDLRYKLYIVAHVVLAAANSYVLARAWKATPHAAAMAAIAYACGGNVVFQYCNVVFLVGAAWLPLAALAADSMLRERSWRAAVSLGTVLAIMILGGDPQTAYHVLLIALLYGVTLALDPARRASCSEAAPSEKFRTVATTVGLTGLAAVVAVALAAVQVLPSWEATGHSERAAYNEPRNIYEFVRAIDTRSFASFESTAGIFGTPKRSTHLERAYDFSVGPWRLAEYFWPNIGGRMFPTDRRWFSLLPAEGRTWTPTLYMGLFPVLLALACFRLRSGAARQRWLSWIVLLFTLGSFGWYGLGWLLREIHWNLTGGKLSVGPQVGGLYWLMVTVLPAYVYFRYPAKLLPLVALGLSQMAATGWDRVFSEPWPRLARALKWFGIVSGVAALAVWLIGPSVFGHTQNVHAALGPFDAAGAHRDLLLALVQGALVASATWWLLRAAWSKPNNTRTWQVAAVVLSAVELTVANYWLVPTAPATLRRGKQPIAAAIDIASVGHSGHAAAAVAPRMFRGSLTGWWPPSFSKTTSPDRVAELARWQHDTLYPKYHLRSGICLVESYGSLALLDYESLLFVARQHGPQQFDESALPQPAALRLTGTEFLLLPQQHAPEFATRVVPGMASESTTYDTGWPEDAALWRMARTLPRAWIVHSVEILPPLLDPAHIAAVDERTKDVLFPDNKARDFRHSAVVETAAALPGLNSSNVEDALADEESCRITHYDPQRVVLEANLNAPGLVVIGEAWYPGWSAVVWSAEGAPQRLPILRTNRVLRGLWLSPGFHRIELRYWPNTFLIGAALSIASWLGTLVLSALSVVRRRREWLKVPTPCPSSSVPHGQIE